MIDKTEDSYFYHLLVSIVGNSLVFYNFTLYGVFASKLGEVFFYGKTEKTL